MNCHATRAVLDLHVEGRLSAKRTQSVVSHLSSCAACTELTAPVPATAVPAPTADFKASLAAAIKASRRGPAKLPAEKVELALWPRDLGGVAIAAAALALIALVVGWSGAPSQQYDRGDELAAGRTP